MAKIVIGGPSRQVSVSLRMMGDDLEPDEITRLLGYEPTNAYRKGEPNKRNQIPVRTGIWSLQVESTDELEPVVTALLESLPSDLATWRKLAARYRIDIFCGIWFEAERLNGGFGLTPKLMRALAERGLEIEFDIYFG